MIYDYNVWCEDEHSEIDHWTEDETEAMAHDYPLPDPRNR
jgi:hypothetical protein